MINSLDTAHTMSIAFLGLTGRGRVRRRKRVERRSQTVEAKGLIIWQYGNINFILNLKCGKLILVYDRHRASHAAPAAAQTTPTPAHSPRATARHAGPARSAGSVRQHHLRMHPRDRPRTSCLAHAYTGMQRQVRHRV